MNERLLKAIDSRRDAVVALTTDLIRFPTINPPGEAYGPCAEYIGARLKKRGFETEFIRAEGAPGDTDRYPRINVVARFDGRSPGACVHFNSHIDVVEAGDGWTVDPFAGIVKD
ncbi:succinyl-diaminopimelate desuccinylase, partial [Mesorhizobium sp. M7A.F.Ca.CA.001.14.1.1]